MMIGPQRQSGMTLIGMILVFFLIGFFVLLILKIGPIYLEHFKVTNSLESLAQMPELARKPPREIRKLLLRRLDINMVENVSPGDIRVSKEDSMVKVSVKYAVEKPIVGNLSVIVDFDDHIEAATP